MDKNKKNNGFPDDLDNLLKDHLNTSFDLDNIKVSEDLIARTLKAVKESDSQEETGGRNKIKHFPVRRLVSAAAVVLVLFAGIRVLQNGVTGSKSDSSGGQENLAAERSANDNGTMQIYGTLDEASSSAGSTGNGETFDAAAADTAGTEPEVPSAEEKINEFSADITTKNADKEDGAGSSSYTGAASFSGIYPLNFDSVKTFTLSKNDGNQISLNNAGDKVSEFYELLDGYPLTETDAKVRDDKKEWIYKADITTVENLTYTILLGEDLQIFQGKERTENTPAGYGIEDMDALIKQLDHFYASLK